MDERTKIKMKCFFCFSDKFLVDENKELKSGDQVKCANCGRMNDFDSMLRVVKKKGVQWAEEQPKKMLKDFEKDIKKYFK